MEIKIEKGLPMPTSISLGKKLSAYEQLKFMEIGDSAVLKNGTANHYKHLLNKEFNGGRNYVVTKENGLSRIWRIK